MQKSELRTGVWYNDRSLTLEFPDEWDIATYWPNTPLALTDAQIDDILAHPIGQPPLNQLAGGKKRPVIVVDDPTRPTPVFRLLPRLIEQLREGGIQPADTRILVATGTHGKPDVEALEAKLGEEAMRACRVVVHSDRRDTKLIGKTSFGSPVFVNRELLDADLIVGVGGVYPQFSTGFGGGGKLALGVLGRKSIRHLHYGHPAMEGSYHTDNDFRRDVTEMAQMIGLKTIYTIHINSRMEIVNLMAGDYTAYYDDAARFSRQTYDAPSPVDADVVIANGYPSDVSYTFMRKANRPILCAPVGATKIIIGSNHGGLGHHGLYPQGKSERWLKYYNLYNRISIMKPATIAGKIIKNLLPKKNRETTAPTGSDDISEGTVWLYTPPGGNDNLPDLTGVRVSTSWPEILEAIRQNHKDKTGIKVRIYPCASLQCIDLPGVD